MVKSDKPRHQFNFVGSNFAILTNKRFDIVDTIENKIVESYDSVSMTKIRLNILNKVKTH